MYPYTKELTLDEALELQQKIKSNQMSNIGMCISSTDMVNTDLSWLDVDYIYKRKDKKRVISITGFDYATHILKQATPPEGYGYPNKELGRGTYNGLQWANGIILDGVVKEWEIINHPELNYTDNYYSVNQHSINPYSIDKWYEVAFRLTDLARVEGETVTPFELPKQEKPLGYNSAYTPPIESKIEINLGQAKWLKEKEQRFTYWLNGVIYKDGLFIEADIYNVRNGDKYELLTSTYNDLPQEFKDLAREEAESEATKPLNQKSFGEIFEESAKNNMWPERPDARPSKQEQTFGQFMGKVLEAVDWESKYHELEKIVDELKTKNEELATAALNLSHNIATTHQTNEKNLQDSLLEAQNTIAIYEKRISDLDYYKSISDDYVKAFEQRDAAKETLKQAEINLIEARNDYYPY
jgi:hypothetical protein